MRFAGAINVCTQPFCDFTMYYYPMGEAVFRTGLPVVVVPGVLLGSAQTLRFYGALLDAFRDSGWVTANPHSKFFPHLVLRLADAAGYDAHAHLSLLYWIAYGVAAANMGLIVRVRWAAKGPSGYPRPWAPPQGCVE